MTKVHSLFTRRGALIAGLCVALLGGGFVFAMHAHAQEGGDFTNRMTLGRDVVKLAIVVMANQTPITRDDARAILPALQAIRENDVITEENALTLDAGLMNALSSPLRQAVDVVRMPQPKAENHAFLQRMAAHHHPGNPAKYGPSSIAFDHLLEFFQETAK